MREMWSRKELKRNGKKNLKKNFWRVVGISLLIAFIASGLKVTQHVDNAALYFVNGRFNTPTNAQIMNDWYQSVRQSGDLEENRVITYLGEHYKPKKGVLAHIYNKMTQEKSALYGFVNAMNDILFKDKGTQGMVILAGVVLLLLFYAFVSNVLRVGQCRFLLENRSYTQSKIGRLLFPWRVKRGKKTAFTMFKMSFFIFLWDLTVIGGIIKRYSYKMIPYILAENPDIGHREAFILSRRMMRGNKWRAFVLDWSFIGWHILNIFTLGILNHVWTIPYTETVYAELYTALRREAKEKQYAYAEYLNDKLLFTESEEEEYPVEKYPLYNPETRQWIKINYKRKYSVRSLILMFFAFSMIGWCWEVALHLFGDGVFVNRGFFYGPWLPIYGTGGVLILLVLKKWQDRPLRLFGMTMLLCGIIEYFSGLALETLFQVRWWNYSDMLFEIQGRVCLTGLLIFGIGGLAIVYIIAPKLEAIFSRIPQKYLCLLCAALLLIFAADIAVSFLHPNTGFGITTAI